MKKNNKGFTLIELLVVIAIIGLLSTLAVVALNSARMKSRDARRVSDIKQIQTAMELYYNDIGAYPGVSGCTVGTGGCTTAGVYLGEGSYTCLDQGGWDSTCSGDIYMGLVPSYPIPRTDVACVGADTDTGYFYSFNNDDQSTYAVEYCLGAQTGGVPSGNQVACQSGVSGCVDPNP
jgi:prepilin-type N-terminal cleavage/methylation domain-containing protein